MEKLSAKIKSLRKQKGVTQTDLAQILGVGKSAVSNYETGYSIPDIETIKIMAHFFDVSTDYLLSHTSNQKLNQKDEKDIAKKLDSILNEMNSTDALMFDGEEIEMDEESRELIVSSIENSLRIAKRLAKEKYTPKKHKK